MHDCTDQGVPVPPTPSLPDTGVFPGERTTTAHSFPTRLADFAPELPVPVWKSLFRQTSGHLLAGQAVLQGADSMGRDPSTVDADHYSDLPSADVRTQIRCQAPDSPELRLAHLLSFMRDINADTLAIAAGAMPYLGSFPVPAVHEGSVPFDIADLSAHLIEDGVLLPSLDRTGHHTIAPVMRTILRRLYDARDRHSESRSRRALGAIAAEWLKAPAAYHTEGFDEALLQVADAGDWSTMTDLWASRGHGLMFDHFDAAIEAYSKIPEAQGQKSAVLAEAMGDCLQADEVRRRLGVSDALTVLNEVNFEHAAVPTLDSQMDRIKDGDFTVDDIMIMAIATMRRQKLLGQSGQGLQVARSAQELISDSRNFQSAPSRLCEARFHLECGITTMFVGDLTARAQLHLTIGEHRTAAQLANRILSQKSLDPHAKATARTIEAASLLGMGELVESDSAFVDALEYCRMTASLIPVALVPKSLRDQLIQRSSSAAEWNLIAPVFANEPGSVDEPHVDDAHFADGSIGWPGGPGSAEQLRQRLRSLGETLRIRAGHTLLSPSQRQLLALLDAQSSVSAIAAELSLVEGTVKNKLSNLYAHLGVRNRRDALARGYEYGYLPSVG